MLRSIRKSVYSIQNIPFIGPFLNNYILNMYNSLYWLNIKSPKMDNNIEHIISLNYQFIYIAIPKVATRSFISFFTDPQYNWNSFIKEDKIANIKNVSSYKNFYCFTFVRHPFDRVISCYKDKILYPTKIHEARVINKYKGLYKAMPFEKFVDWLHTSEGSDEFADRHWLSQHILTNNQCDFIGKIENFHADSLVLQDELNIPLFVLPHKNYSQKSSDIFLSNAIKEKLYRRYYTDFQAFGYELK